MDGVLRTVQIKKESVVVYFLLFFIYNNFHFFRSVYGGRLVLSQVTSDGVKKSTKIGTWFLNKLNSLDFLDEEYFNKIMKEENIELKEDITEEIFDDYDDDKANFAPYHYGILIFDFKDKKVFSLNNYNGFLIFGQNNIFKDYEKIGRTKQEEINIYTYKDNKPLKSESIYESNNLDIKTPRMIESCIRLGGEIYINDKRFIIRKNDDFFSIAAKLYGKDIYGMTNEEFSQYSYERNRRLINKDGSFDLNDWTNIKIQLLGWEIINGDSTKNYIRSAFYYYSVTNLLTDKEKKLWEDFLYKTSEKEE